MNNSWFVGLVQNGNFRPLVAEHPAPGTYRLTTEPRGSAQPEAGELSLTSYEGSAVYVRGIDGDGWVYSASILEQAGAILTIVVQRLFGAERLTPPA